MNDQPREVLQSWQAQNNNDNLLMMLEKNNEQQWDWACRKAGTKKEKVHWARESVAATFSAAAFIRQERPWCCSL